MASSSHALCPPATDGRSWLSPKARARVVGALKPQRLLWATLALGVIVLGAHLASFLAQALGHSWPPIPYGLVYLPLVAVHFLRWGLIRAGWGPVLASELALLPYALGRDRGWSEDLPTGFQDNLARRLTRQGWLSWRDVLDVGRDYGLTATHSDWFLMVGGMKSPLARRKDLEAVVLPEVWRNATLHLRLPPAAARSSATRTRL